MGAMQFPNTFLSGTVQAFVNDNNGAPSEVLEASLPFTVDVTWQLSALTALLLSGEFTAAAYVESIGAGPEKEIGKPVHVALNGTTGPHHATIKVAANELPNDPQPPDSGVYKIVTVLTHKNVFGKPTNVAGIVDGPLVRIG